MVIFFVNLNLQSNKSQLTEVGKLNKKLLADGNTKVPGPQNVTLLTAVGSYHPPSVTFSTVSFIDHP